MFTDRQVRALRSKEIRYEKKEPGRTGLAIRVYAEGTQDLVFRLSLQRRSEADGLRKLS